MSLAGCPAERSPPVEAPLRTTKVQVVTRFSVG